MTKFYFGFIMVGLSVAVFAGCNSSKKEEKATPNTSAAAEGGGNSKSESQPVEPTKSSAGVQSSPAEAIETAGKPAKLPVLTAMELELVDKVNKGSDEESRFLVRSADLLNRLAGFETP